MEANDICLRETTSVARKRFLFASLAFLALGAGAIVYVVSIGPRFRYQVNECMQAAAKARSDIPDLDVIVCMRSHGWSYNDGLIGCSRGKPPHMDIGCYETGSVLDPF